MNPLIPFLAGPIVAKYGPILAGAVGGFFLRHVLGIKKKPQAPPHQN